VVINCSVCSTPMVIDEPNGEAYITEADGKIHHEVCPQVAAEGVTGDAGT